MTDTKYDRSEDAHSDFKRQAFIREEQKVEDSHRTHDVNSFGSQLNQK